MAIKVGGGLPLTLIDVEYKSKLVFPAGDFASVVSLTHLKGGAGWRALLRDPFVLVARQARRAARAGGALCRLIVESE